MLSRLFGHHDTKPDFPTSADLPQLTPGQAMAALGLLRLLLDSGMAEVYTAAGGLRADGLYLWNIWLSDRITPGGKRVPLREWAANVVCRDFTPDDAA
jgi:hypothetical protein